MVVAFSDLKALDFSENSGQALRIESEQQVYTMGKSEDFVMCKGAPKGASKDSLATITMAMSSQTCKNFLNKAHETICETHRFQMESLKMTQIRSSRVSLHSDFIDVNQAKKQQIEEAQEKKQWTSGFAKRLKQSANTTYIPQLSPKSKAKVMHLKATMHDQHD